MEHDAIEFVDRLVHVARSCELDTCRQLHSGGHMAMDFADAALKASPQPQLVIVSLGPKVLHWLSAAP
jgi:hypothetical protein